jgi:hypothetical protein
MMAANHVQIVPAWFDPWTSTRRNGSGRRESVKRGSDITILSSVFGGPATALKKLPTDHNVPASGNVSVFAASAIITLVASASQIGGGRRHITGLVAGLGRRRRSGLRWRRTSRGRRLGARVLSPVISVEQPESRETGERRGYPRPDVAGAAGPLGTAPPIVAVRIRVARVRHDSTPFLVDINGDMETAYRRQCSGPRTDVPPFVGVVQRGPWRRDAAGPSRFEECVPCRCPP